MIQLQSTQTLTPVNHCMIYGKGGCGKTRLFATAPNPVVCSTDEGLLSLRDHNIPFFKVATYADYLKFEESFKRGELSQFDTIGIDDLTELAEIYIKEEKPKHKNAMQAYGKLNEEMMRIVRFWRSVENAASVLICKQEKVKDEAVGTFLYGPMIPGKAVAPMLPYLWGNVYHMEDWKDPQTNQTHEVLRCKQNSQYEAKDRSGKLSELELANLATIFAKVLS